MSLDNDFLIILATCNRRAQHVTHLSGTDGLTEFAGDAPLLSVGVPTEGVFPTEAGTEWTLLKGVHQSDRFPEEGGQSD